jgi:TPP-dependent pyruvate/acetoin dehydrogenase alpha subunit
MSDPVAGVYRTKEEVEEHKQKDPIARFREVLENAELLTEEELKAMDEGIHRIVNEAAVFAENSPEPGVEELYRHVYADEDVNGRLFFDRKNRLNEDER